MRPGVRTAVTALILGALILTGFGVDRLWHRVAEKNSRALVTALVSQITNQVRNEFWAEVVGIEERFAVLRARLASMTLPADALDRALLINAGVETRAFHGWIAHIAADGSVAARRSEPDGGATLVVNKKADGSDAFLQTRLSPAKGARPDITGPAAPVRDIRDESWFAEAWTASGPTWSPVAPGSVLDGAVAAYAAPLDGASTAKGLLAAFARPSDLSRLLGRVEVGATGAAYMISPDGVITAPPDIPAEQKERLAAQDRVRLAATSVGARIKARPDGAKNIVETIRLTAGEEYFSVALSPLEFRDWQLAVIIPEREFLEEIDATTQRVAWAVLALVALAGLASVWLARRYIVAPVVGAVADLKSIEMLRLDLVRRRPSQLEEFAALSDALQRVSTGLSAFAKYIPIDLVRTLLSEGVEARPGGEQRQITILFADIEGFTGMSERLGAGIVPIVSAYFEAMTGAISAHGGTVDKFIGDAVMAFWGAPRADADQAARACAAALACLDAIRTADIRDDRGAPLKVRIGLNSGMALVGNIGSADRLNYTAIGDCVNVASRLEGANKFYGTSILVGEATRDAAGDAVAFREIDRAAVYGRAGGMRLYEPLAERGGAWLDDYANALADYRAGRFETAAIGFGRVLKACGDDGPAATLKALSEGHAVAPPGRWNGVTIMDSK